MYGTTSLRSMSNAWTGRIDFTLEKDANALTWDASILTIKASRTLPRRATTCPPRLLIWLIIPSCNWDNWLR